MGRITIAEAAAKLGIDTRDLGTLVFSSAPGYETGVESEGVDVSFNLEDGYLLDYGRPYWNVWSDVCPGFWTMTGDSIAFRLYGINGGLPIKPYANLLMLNDEYDHGALPPILSTWGIITAPEDAVSFPKCTFAATVTSKYYKVFASLFLLPQSLRIGYKFSVNGSPAGILRATRGIIDENDSSVIWAPEEISMITEFEQACQVEFEFSQKYSSGTNVVTHLYIAEEASKVDAFLLPEELSGVISAAKSNTQIEAYTGIRYGMSFLDENGDELGITKPINDLRKIQVRVILPPGVGVVATGMRVEFLLSSYSSSWVSSLPWLSITDPWAQSITVPTNTSSTTKSVDIDGGDTMVFISQSSTQEELRVRLLVNDRVVSGGSIFLLPVSSDAEGV